MKSLILKDLYNIGHNSKTMIFILIILAAFFIPLSGPYSFVAISTMMCSMMVITTFSFDDMVNWNHYALIMPITRKDVVTSKYIMLLIFSLEGLVFGLAVSFIASFFLKKLMIGEMLLSGLISLELALFFGSIIIPLLFKYGAEKARILTILCFLVPVGIFYFVFQFAKSHNMCPGSVFLNALLWITPLAVAAVIILSIVISLSIFNKKELS